EVQGQSHRGENSDEQDNDQQLNQGEPGLTVAPERPRTLAHHHRDPPDSARGSEKGRRQRGHHAPQASGLPSMPSHKQDRVTRSGTSSPASSRQPEYQFR